MTFSEGIHSQFALFHRGLVKVTEIRRRPFGASPICCVISARDEPGEAGIWPVARAVDQTVFHRVIVDVVTVLREVVFIFQDMFPEATLPDSPSSVTAL